MPFKMVRGLPTCTKSGIYLIVNKVNSKVYVGSAAAIRGRLLAHRSYLRRGIHDNEYLQRAWLKYGEGQFRFEVLEVCELDRLIEREQYWIDALLATDRDMGYNICPAAGSAMTGRKHSQASREKMSRKRKGIIPVKATEAAAEANRGRVVSDEARANMSAAKALNTWHLCGPTTGASGQTPPR